MKRFSPLLLLLTACFYFTSAGTLTAQCQSGDCKNGYGTYSYSTGDKFTGYFANGKRNGQGTYTWANGNVHVGENKDDQLHGQGTYTFTSLGHKYIGNFAYGVRSGYGTFFWKNGDKYEGYWMNDKMHGQGTYTYSTGKVDKGYWENDVYQGSSTRPDGGNFCTSLDKIRSSMEDNFSSIKGTQHWDEEKSVNYWTSTVSLPGATYSDIEGAGEGTESSAYYKFLKTSSYTEAESKFYAIKAEMEKCIPYDWFPETDTNFDDERMEYVMMDEDYYYFAPGRYISLQMVKDKNDGHYYVEIFCAKTTY